MRRSHPAPLKTRETAAEFLTVVWASEIMRFLVPGTIVLLLAQAALPREARAQTPPEPQTRAEAQRQAREEKQKHLAPYEPDGIERAIDLAENRIVPLL